MTRESSLASTIQLHALQSGLESQRGARTHNKPNTDAHLSEVAAAPGLRTTGRLSVEDVVRRPGGVGLNVIRHAPRLRRAL